MSPQEKLIRFIDPMTATALIGAGASVAGGVINGVGSIFTRKKDRKFAHDEAVLARQHAEDMYNKYASPAAQRQQMLEAGLNPMGAISPQSVGTSSSQASTPSGSVPDFGSALTGGFAGYVQGKQLAMQIKTQKLANDIAEEDLKTKQLDNQMKAIEAGNYQEYYNITLDMLKNDKEFKDLSKKEQDLKVKQMYEAAKNGWNPFENEEEAADDAHDIAEFNKRIAKVSAEVTESTKDYQIKKSKAEMDSALEAAEVAMATRQYRIDLEEANRNLQKLAAAGAQDQFNYNQWVKTFIDLLGFDPRILPPALQATVLYELDSLHKDFPDGVPADEWLKFNTDLADRLYNYRTKDYHIPTTYSSSTGFQVMGNGISSSSSYTN